MKPFQVADDIVPIGEFKAHASEVIRTLRTRGRPLVITQNGKPAAVLMSPEDFDRLTSEARFQEAVREGLADSESGRLVSDEALSRKLDEQHGRHETGSSSGPTSVRRMLYPERAITLK